MGRKHFDTHAHTMYSNLRLLDCINRPKDLIDKAIELGLSGIAITDHECLSSHMEINKYAKQLQETNPDFTIAFGNEIYLVSDRSMGQEYYHFILIAKDALGHKALRELSSTAWYHSYFESFAERAPTLKSELKSIVQKYKGHLIATSACLGGELPSNALQMCIAEASGDLEVAQTRYTNITTFLDFAIDLFGDDFYIECAPSAREDQMTTNYKLYKIAKAYNIKMVVGTDSHYLGPKNRPIHKAYLQSTNGKREVDAFYEFARLMSSEEVAGLLELSFNKESIKNTPEDIVDWIFENTLELQRKISFYSLEKAQVIPTVEVKDYPAGNYQNSLINALNFPVINALLNSKEVQEKYWINECLNALKEQNLDNQEYLQRIETEADIVKYIGDNLGGCLFAYFNTFKHYIDLFWECGSIVGPGRGSATGFLSNYLLGITQLDPVKWGLPHWRFLNKERVELPDIDIDLAPSKRPLIFQKIREERGELGLIQVSTFGTEGTKSAILTACRGYRSDEYPEGIDIDIAHYMSSLIPMERGFLWDIDDVINGNELKDRQPVAAFTKEAANYPGLLEIITSICGLVNKRSTHASGVILYGDDLYETSSIMRAPGGDLITCYDLHQAESSGDTKYDFLVTEVSDKIIQCVELLQNDGCIERDSLRNIYNKYLHPEVINVEDQRLWDHLSAGDVLDVFQFNSGVGLAIAKKLKPQNPIEMTAANAMMRLMSKRGEESQQERYYRIHRNGIALFDAEMKKYNLPEDMMLALHKYCDKYYGCVPIQEQMMQILMDGSIAKFTLGEANAARKIIAKKQMDKIPNLKKQVYDKIPDVRQADYIWKLAVEPQLGYAFSLNHSLPYSFVGLQTIYLATSFNPIYWNTACLIVNSGATDENAGSSTDYGKIAKAIGDIMSAGTSVTLADINNSDFGFKPDAQNNKILFGLKGIINVGDDLISKIIANRPYASPKDFLNKVAPGKQAMISLIKGGAFDSMEDRKFLMAWYILEVCDKKKRVTLQNMTSLIKYNLLPEDTIEHKTARRVYEFNRYLKLMCKITPNATHYQLNTRAVNFLTEINQDALVEQDEAGVYILNIQQWDRKVYQNWMDLFRQWVAMEKDEILNNLNTYIFLDDWNKYATGTISSWEMESLCFYYNQHELAHLNIDKYGFSNFFALPEDPEVDRVFTKGGKEIKMFKLHKICGTCIAKDKSKSIITLLTTTGVVNVKFRKEYFTLFDKQISERDSDGVKHVVEKSWFSRGNMILVMGIRSGDDFIAKKYASSGGHQLYKIDEITTEGDLVLKDGRYQGGVEEDV